MRSMRRAMEERMAKKEKKAKKINILQTIRNFCDRLKDIRDQAERIKAKKEKLEAFWNASHVERARELAWKELLYLFRHTKPRRISGFVRFGFDDPALTGYAMAAYGVLHPIWVPQVSVEPDFENEVFDCRVELRGKVRVWRFAWAAAKLFFSKDVRRAVKGAKKLMNEDR